MKNMFDNHKITILLELSNSTKSLTVAAKFTEYVSKIFDHKKVKITTGLQKYNLGYRVTVDCIYSGKINYRYLNKLNNLSDWVITDNDFCISKYRYDFT